MSEALHSSNVRGLFTGSGAGMAEPGMAERVIALIGRDAAGLELLYLGTATYDVVEPRGRQVSRFVELGCRVHALDVATGTPSEAEIRDAVERADAVLVSGGNTLYAVDRWKALGIDRMLREAIERGAVMCAGSAGAICWFDGGHSDSMDPTSYLRPIPVDDPRAADWRYIRVDGLGVLSGLVCPHYEVTQSNGVLRATDFGQMMTRHPGETGLGLDNWAGLLVSGDRYEVVHPEGRKGSVRDGRFVADGAGIPGVWVLEVADGVVTRRLAPSAGLLNEILRSARIIEPDPLVELCRAENPGDAAAPLR